MDEILFDELIGLIRWENDAPTGKSPSEILEKLTSLVFFVGEIWRFFIFERRKNVDGGFDVVRVDDWEAWLRALECMELTEDKEREIEFSFFLKKSVISDNFPEFSIDDLRRIDLE